MHKSKGRRCLGFDFTLAIRGVCADMVTRLPELHHIDLARVAIGFTQTRKDVSHGMYASLTPMRFEAGASKKVIDGKTYGVQLVCDAHGIEYLYILTFYLPRFLQTSFEEKISTIIHELWHISPNFDGDLRRHAGRCYAHGASQSQYDARMDQLAQRWLESDPPVDLYEFLEYSFEELRAQHGSIIGTRYASPRLVPRD